MKGKPYARERFPYDTMQVFQQVKGNPVQREAARQPGERTTIVQLHPSASPPPPRVPHPSPIVSPPAAHSGSALLKTRLTQSVGRRWVMRGPTTSGIIRYYHISTGGRVTIVQCGIPTSRQRTRIISVAPKVRGVVDMR